MIQLQTLGDAVILVGDREVRPTSPTLFAALLYLGVERGQKVPRAALQELLFPETDERSGAHSMRQLLYKVRQLGVSVHAEGDVVWLASEDVSDDYSAPAQTNGNGNGHGSANGNGQRGAAFLAGYAPRVSKAFDEWLESCRTTVEAGRRRALIKYMLARRGVADWITVERVAQEVLATDPFNEEATFALAESTALGGSKSEAVRILERYESETGSADLKLPAAVLRRRISERLPDRRRRALDTPFLGRDAEAEVMRQAVVNLRAGDGGSIVISGEPGIGKTRLIEETSAIALLEGVNVHVVRCQPHYASRPMGVFIEWIPMLLQSRGALGVAPETLEHLKLLTSHRDDRPNRPTDARDDATRSGTLMAGIRDLVDAVATEASIMLVVEDAHWADAISLRELCTLLEKRRGAALLIVHSTRVAEPLREAGVLAETTPLLRLKPLGDGPMHALTKHLLVADDYREPTKLRDWYAQTAGGNPLYLQMLCAHLEDTRQPYAIPSGLRTTTTRRLQHLPSEARRLIEYCALLGRHSTLDAMQTLVNLPSEIFLNTIQRLEEEGFLRTSGGIAQLSHDLLRECTLDMLPPLSRQVMHGSVATFLEARFEATKDSSSLWDCAEHWAANGNANSAILVVLRCARHATDIGQAAHAIPLLKAARKFGAHGRQRLALLEELAVAARAAGEWDELLNATREARSLVRAEGMPDLSWEWEFRAIEAHWSTNFDSERSYDALMGCAASQAASHANRVQAAYMLVRIACETGDSAIAHKAFEAVAPLLEARHLDYSSRLLPLLFHTSFGDQARARSIAAEIEADLALFSITDCLRAARNISVALCGMGDAPRALAIGRRHYGHALRLGLVSWQYDFAATCCAAAINLESYEEAGEFYRKACAARTAPSIADYSLYSAGIELAINANDAGLARSRLAEFVRMGSPSARYQAVVVAYRTRVAHLDPDYASDDDEIVRLRETYLKSIQLGCGDMVAGAYCLALVRRNYRDQAKAFAIEHLRNERRDLGQWPTILIRMAQNPSC